MTLTQFRALHGDPKTWCGAEVEEYLAECDRVEALFARMDRAAEFIKATPGATPEQIIEVFRGGGVR